MPDTLAPGEAEADRTQVKERDVDLQVGGDSADPFVEDGVSRDPEDTVLLTRLCERIRSPRRRPAD